MNAFDAARFDKEYKQLSLNRRAAIATVLDPLYLGRQLRQIRKYDRAMAEALVQRNYVQAARYLLLAHDSFALQRDRLNGRKGRLTDYLDRTINDIEKTVKELGLLSLHLRP